MTYKFYTYEIEIEISDGQIYQMEINTEDLLDLVLRCKYKSILIYNKQQHRMKKGG